MKASLTSLCLFALLTGAQAADSSSLINVSSRGLAGSGENSLANGFVVRANPGELRWVLVRSIGPSLAAFGVTNPLQDPVLTVRDSKGTAVAVNDNWSDAPNLTLINTVLPLAGAFTVSDSHEAVALLGVPTGDYTVVSTGKSDTPGIVLSEVYELGSIDSETTSQTLSGLAASNPNLTTLATALRVTGLDVALAGNGSLTVFAPTDAAFAALPAGTLDTLIANPSQLADILKYHVLASKVLSTDLSDGLAAPTLLAGASVTVHLSGGAKINDANVVIADVPAVNGVVHVIDKVLLPPSGT